MVAVARPNVEIRAMRLADVPTVSALENAVRQAHQSVYQRGVAETDKQGMGTTLDVVLIAGAEAFVAHVGRGIHRSAQSG